MIAAPTTDDFIKSAEIDSLAGGDGDSQLLSDKLDLYGAADASISVTATHLMATLIEGEETGDATSHEELLEGHRDRLLDSDMLQLLAVNLAYLGSS